MEVLLVLLAIAYAATPIVALVIAWMQKSVIAEQGMAIKALRTEMAALRDRLEGFDTTRSGEAPVAPTTRSEKTPTEETVSEPVATPPEAAASSGPSSVPPIGRAARAASSPPPEVPPKPKRSLADIETLIGAKWSVLMGGLAVALGAVFLVRY
ncbi:MAG: hypothetical protein R3D34_06305, partial [Nitratireductor sp.]